MEWNSTVKELVSDDLKYETFTLTQIQHDIIKGPLEKRVFKSKFEH